MQEVSERGGHPVLETHGSMDSAHNNYAERLFKAIDGFGLVRC